MNVKVLLLLLWVCLSSEVYGAPRVVDVDNGDSETLVRVLCDAALGKHSETVIYLAERGYYAPARSQLWLGCSRGGFIQVPLPPAASDITTHVTIKGRNATLDLEQSRGFHVEVGGTLILESVELRNGISAPALRNDGETVLRRVSVLYNQPSFNPPLWSGVIHNRGQLEMRNSVVAFNRMASAPPGLFTGKTPFELCTETGSAGIFNEGELIINNVSSFSNLFLFTQEPQDEQTWSCAGRDLINMPDASAVISNTILSSSISVYTGASRNCAGMVQSLGYNTVPSGANCGFDGPGDVVFNEDDIPAYVPHDSFRQLGRELFVPDERRRRSGSPEPFASSPSACETHDIRGYIRDTASGECDRGALDVAATPDLNVGFGGMWFDPDNDGQYLQISHFGHDQILLVWHSFDANGDAVWVYGTVISKGGDRFETQAFHNTGIRLIDGLLEGSLEANPWGVISVQVKSCNLLQFSFQSVDDLSGSGEYLLRRLTDNTAADCFDQLP